MSDSSVCSKQDIESTLQVFHRQQLRLDSNLLQALMLQQFIRNLLGPVCDMSSITAEHYLDFYSNAL